MGHLHEYVFYLFGPFGVQFWVSMGLGLEHDVRHSKLRVNVILNPGSLEHWNYYYSLIAKLA
jgi:hypothetical protein